MLKREELRIRDPFILVENGTYYMYGSADMSSTENNDYGSYPKFSAFVSKDLENFDGPFTVFDGQQCNFWSDREYWAAEVWKYQGNYYLFGSFHSATRCRGTQILKSNSPLGPFKPISDYPQTPEHWECLDGTLAVDDGTPYMVFCHEWLQCHDGEMCLIQLSNDLSKAVSEPIVLFKASDHPLVTSHASKDGRACFVTDGPHLWKENGKWNMIWSSFCSGKYAVLKASAEKLQGPWKQETKCFDFDGGHAMLFTDLNGQRRISLHQPNVGPYERAFFLEYSEK